MRYGLRLTLRITTLASLILLAACATSSENAEYRPDKLVVQQMSADEAREVIRASCKHHSLLPTGCAMCSYAMDVDVCRVLSDRIEFQGQNYNHDTPPMVFRFDALELGVNRMLFLGGASEVLLNRGWRLMQPTYDDGVRLAKALYVLKQAGSPAGIAEEEARFEREVRAYRAANPKPDLSEEARKFKVQAEFAVAQKHFSESADLYAKALALAPWWPEGHFNRALVSGEIGSYNEAIHEMKHYLLLAPDAPNARAAQDKIYQWESMVSK